MKSSTVALPDGVQTPRIRHAPNVRQNAWEDVSDLCKAYGLVLDPWQENVLEAGMGERADGTWAARHVGLSVPRQNGKGEVAVARELAGLLLFGERMLIHSAHEVRTAQVGFQRMKSYFENFDDLRKKVSSIGNAVAREYIRLKNGQELRFVTRSRSAIRGFSADVLVLDEAQILDDNQWEAILYTVSARPNHQVWLMGTPPQSIDDGIVFTRFRDRGIEGKDTRSAWCEWSAPPDADLDDPMARAVANPAMGSRISHGTVADERAVASDEGFARERLGMWADIGGRRVISAQLWEGLADVNLVDGGGDVAIAVDVSPGRDITTIVSAAFTTAGVPYVDVIDTRKDATEWGLDRLVELCSRHQVRAVVIDGRSPANTWVDPLRQRGVTVTVTTATQMAKACGGFFDACHEDRVRHLDQPALNVALSVARKRPIGDGGWGWSRKDSESDITALVGATLALWGLTTSEIEDQPKARSGKACFV